MKNQFGEFSVALHAKYVVVAVVLLQIPASTGVNLHSLWPNPLFVYILSCAYPRERKNVIW